MPQNHLGVLAQYRLEAQVFERLKPASQALFHQYLEPWGWILVNETYFSPPLSLPIPELSKSELTLDLEPPAPLDKIIKPLLEELKALCRVQFCLIDLVSVSSRGPQMARVESTAMADRYGSSFHLNPLIPPPITYPIRSLPEYRNPQNRTRFNGYFYVLADTEVLGGHSDLLYRSSSRSLEVRSLDVFLHGLSQEGTTCHYTCKRLVSFQHDPTQAAHNHLERMNQPELRDVCLSLLEGIDRQKWSNDHDLPPYLASKEAKGLLESIQKHDQERIKKDEESLRKNRREQERKALEERRRIELEEIQQQHQQKAKAQGLSKLGFVPRSAPLPPPPASVPDLAIDPELIHSLKTYLQEGMNLLLVGPPGCGKTYLATWLAAQMCGSNQKFIRTEAEVAGEFRCVHEPKLCHPERCARYTECFVPQGDNFTFITADARWTSLDVVGGLRAQPGQGLNYGYEPGVVTRAAQAHQLSEKQTGRPHYLVLDEFNRANQDEAFGRLFTLLDRAYRQKMPLSSLQENGVADFFMPDGFRIIATMNDQDSRSLYPVGSALGRRFVRVNVGLPEFERTWMHTQGFAKTALEPLYAFVGEATDFKTHTGERVRSFYPLGTSLVLECLQLSSKGISLDRVIADKVVAQLVGLGRDKLERLTQTAQSQNLPLTQSRLENLSWDQTF